MPLSGFADHVSRFQRLTDAALGQLATWSEPQRRRTLLERALREASEAGSDMATSLLSGSWRTPTEEMDRRIQILLQSRNLGEFGTDPFGLSPASVRQIVPVLEFLYRVYFRVEVQGIQNVPNGRCLLISNHSGQLPFDGAMIGTALLLEHEPPRIVRSMVEKFATSLPYFGQLCVRCGQVTGLPDNCRRLLEREECVQVFPEGARGISKLFRDRYRMTPFGHGFMRLALETSSPVVPIAVVGAEEQSINLYDAKLLAKLFHAPSFAITPLTPFLGPAGLLPMPVKYRIYFGEPLSFEGDPNGDEAVIATKVAQVRAAVQRLIERGLAERKGILV